MLMPKLLLLLAALCLLLHTAGAQDAAKGTETITLSPKLYAFLSQKSADAETRLNKATEKYLAKLLKQETKLRDKVVKVDSIKAPELFAGIEEKYAALTATSQKLSKYPGVYSGHLDSLTISLNFLKSNGLSDPQLNTTLSQFSSLQAKLNQTEAVKKFLNERKRLLKENLERLGMLKELKGFSKQAFYYSAQLKEYKALWENPSKLEQKLLEWAVRSEPFKAFFRQSSQLASLFALPGGNTSTASLQGLQTRASVQQALAARFGSGSNVQQMLQQNMQAAQGQLNELKSKLSQYGAGSVGNGGDVDLPDGFSINGQRTKTLLQRLEYGVNIQSQKARSYFPVTTDVGLSLGYKLNDKSSMGCGISYKIGWGRGWEHIRMTSEGVGLRSYLDYRLKGSLYLSGGYEQNYRNAFQSVQQLKSYSAWQSSGLVGLSKRYRVSKKVKGDVKLLWDFLSYQQIPRTQTLLFRVGYSLK